MKQINPFICAILTVIFLIISLQRNSVWKDDIHLWEDVIKKSPLKPRSYNEAGIAYMEAGQFEKAIIYYETVLRLNPLYTDTHINLGLAYDKIGLTDKAIEHYLISLRYKADPTAYLNLGLAYISKGRFYDALDAFRNAMMLNPLESDAHNNIGIVYEKLGLMDEAIKQYQTALLINPESEIARFNLNRIMRARQN